MKKIWITAVVLAALVSLSGGAAEAGSLKGQTKKTEGPVIAQKADRPSKVSVSSRKKANKKEADTSSIRKTAGAPVIEIGLLSGQKEVKIQCLSDTVITANGKKWQTVKKGQTVATRLSGKQITVNGKKTSGTVLMKGTSDGAAFGVKGNTYRGDMKLILSAYSSGMTVVNAVSMEEYLYGVLPYEVSPSWHADALRAQAVAARTYAVYHKDGYRTAGYDVTDDTRSQVYKGTASESPATNRAVADTAGEILTYGGKAIDAVFHASGGGYTENAENVWGSQTPYLKGVPEESSPMVNQAWTKTITITELQNAAGVGAIKKIELSKLKKGPMKTKDRGISGRVKTLTIQGKKGKKTLTGSQVQDLFGLSSTLFDIDVKGKKVLIKGYGAGHGLGLSQWGAEAMAEKHGDGKDYYKKILLHYFQGTKIEKAY